MPHTVENRFGVTVGGNYTIEDPLQCLVYDRESIADDTLDGILTENQEHWHMVLIVENDVLILNRSLPLSEIFAPSSDDFGSEGMPEIPPEYLAMLEEQADINLDPAIITLDNGLFWFLITISASIPDPMSVNTANSLNALSKNIRFQTEAVTDMDEDG